MTTHSDIVRRAGSAEEVARDHGVSVHTVRSWIQRDSIPSDRWASFVRRQQATLKELAEAAETRRVRDDEKLKAAYRPTPTERAA